MSNDRIEGIGHQIKGAVTGALGRILGDAKLTADGAAERASGDMQVAAAGATGQVLGIDSDRIKGVAHQIEGALKQGIGNVIADPGLQQAGVLEREAGRVQNAAGSARDTARNAVEKGE